MKNCSRSISGAMICMIILLTASFAQCETGPVPGKISSATGQRMKWNSVEEIIKELALPRAQPVTKVADGRDGDAKLLRELLDQSNGELRAAWSPRTTPMKRTGLIASRY